ncbi:MAG: hypothetical protein JWN87_1998 [Frankiales bacterium]|nr:hypothetical protein [Frankiales bacterium]
MHHVRVLSELQALAEGLATRLDRGVAIDDQRLRLLVHTAHHGPVDEARLESIMRLQALPETVAWVLSLGIDRTAEPVLRVPANPALASLARVCAPLRLGAELLGYLWLIDADESLTEAELGIVAETARSAALVVQRERLLDDLEAGRQREAMRDLLADDQSVRSAAAEALATAVEPHAGRASVVVLQVPEVPDRTAQEVVAAVDDALDRAARRLVPRRCLRLARVDHGVLVVPSASNRRGLALEVAVMARAELARVLDVTDLRSGIGDEVADHVELLSSYRQAQSALRVAQIVPGFGPDVAWSELGVYRVLVHLPLEALPQDAVPPRLLGLLDSASGRELVRTVEVFLDQAADIRSTAATLSVHRTSLYYRLSRFTELTGLDLHDGKDRLSVHLGLKLARLSGMYAESSRARPRAR